MSYKIPLLGGQNYKPLDDSKFPYILVKLCPQAWHTKYAEATACLDVEPTLDYTVKYLETLEHTSDLVQASNLGGKRIKNQEGKNNSNKRHKASKQQDKGREKYYQICKNAGRPEWLYKNHNTKDCKKGKDDNQGKNGKSCHHSSGKRYQEKIFASFMEFQKKEKTKKSQKGFQKASRNFQHF